MNEIAKNFMSCVSDEKADSLMLAITLTAMDKKLAQKRNEGRGGWFKPEFSDELLREMLVDHLNKNDILDVLNLSAMLFVRQKLYEEA